MTWWVIGAIVALWLVLALVLVGFVGTGEDGDE